MSWVDVCNAASIAPGMWESVTVEDVSVLIFNVDGVFYAIENLCTHDGGTLSDGYLENDEIICPRHGARFCIKNGAVTRPPAYEDIKSFAARVHDGKVQIQIEDF